MYFFEKRKIACGGELAVSKTYDHEQNKIWSRKCNITILSSKEIEYGQTGKVGIRYAE